MSSGTRRVASTAARSSSTSSGTGRLWYSLSGLLLVISIAGLLVNGLNLGVEFKGGSVFSFKPPPAVDIEQVRATFSDQGVHQADRADAGRTAGGSPPRASPSDDGDQGPERGREGVRRPRRRGQHPGRSAPRWGGEVSKKACDGLVVFMLAIILYLSMAFEWKMALAAIVALLHDLVITAGVYAWSGFEVTPATLLGLPDDPRLLALRRGRRVRHDQGESPPSCGTHLEDDLHRGGQQRAQPHADPVAEHLPGRDPAGRGDPVHRHHAARRGHAEGPVAGAVRRHGRRHLLLAVRRDAAAGRRSRSGSRATRPSPAGSPPSGGGRASGQEGPTASGDGRTSTAPPQVQRRAAPHAAAVAERAQAHDGVARRIRGRVPSRGRSRHAIDGAIRRDLPPRRAAVERPEHG